MGDKVIDFAQAQANQEKNMPGQEKSMEQRKKEAIAQLRGYRGEVPSKNTIRGLPGVEPGQIFWVDMDHKAYLVAAKEGKKVTIKALDETATVSTGITIYDMNKSIVSKEPLFDFKNEEAVAALDERINHWFANETEGATHFLLYGRDIHYVSFIDYTGDTGKSPAQVIRECLHAVGDLISIDFNTSDGEPALEIWMRTQNSLAELLYLFPFEKGIVRI